VKRVIKGSFITGVFLFIAPVFLFANSASEAINAEKLVNRFNVSTDVQKKQLNKLLRGGRVIATGVISNVEERSFLDEARGGELRVHYYTAITELQEASQGANYSVVFCYEDVDDVEQIRKGQRIEETGKLIRISNEGVEGVWISVWLYMESSYVK